MLLEFRIKNFRSFRDENTLSLVASKDQDLLQANTFGLDAPVPRAVRSAVVYGANASGKSNLVRALQLMRGVVVESASLKPEQLFNVQPFRLSDDSAREPTLFEVSLALNGERFQYGFTFTPQRIVSEWLLVYRTSKPQRWFTREFDSIKNKEVFRFGPHLNGPKTTWRDATRPNALFLSTAVQLNSEQLRPLVDWFTNSLVVLMDGGMMPFNLSTERIQNPEGHTAVRSLMEAADIGIAAISAVRQKSVTQTFNLDLQTGKSNALTSEGELIVPKFKHVAGDVSADFDLFDESQGTQKLFALAGPLLDIISRGSVLVIDELDRSLHPLLVRQIVEAFQSGAPEECKAQLIFTTHDTSLLDAKLLRRDQIWLTEKRQDQSSHLIPLTEFSPRKNEALEKGYLGGRYGGVPILGGSLISGSWRGEQ
jgi:AAA15 family ATPase/GTPase